MDILIVSTAGESENLMARHEAISVDSSTIANSAIAN
jgi:hypothetical protein